MTNLNHPKRRNARGTAVLTTAAVFVAVFTVAPAAGADDSESLVSSSVVAQSLSGVDGALLLTPAEGSGVGAVELDGGIVDVPRDLTDGVTIKSFDEAPVVVGLPGAEGAGDATVLADGTVTYPAEDFSNSVIVSELGVQMLTTIADESAPTSYEYTLALEPGLTLQLVDGGAEVTDTDGRTVMTVTAPWAKDAAGQSIPTHYTVDGNTLVQVVEHTSVSDAVYPVVADPAIVPWVVARCLLGLGLNWSTIMRIWGMGGAGSVQAAFGYAAARCVMGR